MRRTPVLRRFPGRGAGFVLPAAAALCCLLASAVPAPASEPQGRLAFETEGMAGSHSGAPAGTSPADPRPARVTIRSRVALTDVRVSVRAPLETAIRPLAGVWSEGTQSFGSGRILKTLTTSAGTLDPARPFTIEIEIFRPESRGGVVSVLVEGRDARGRLVREGAGLTVDAIRPAGRKRNGAIEFPATVIPGTDR